MSTLSILNEPNIANSSSILKHLTMGPYGSSGSSTVDRAWNKGIVVVGSEVSMSLMATRTAWTVSTRWSFRRRLMYSEAYCDPWVEKVVERCEGGYGVS
jgi:hypothetical protein